MALAGTSYVTTIISTYAALTLCDNDKLAICRAVNIIGNDNTPSKLNYIYYHIVMYGWYHYMVESI